MKSSAIILKRYILNDSSYGENSIVTSTKNFSLGNISSSSFSSIRDILKKDLNVNSNILEPSVDVEVNIDLVKDEATHINSVSEILPRGFGISKGLESNAPVISPAEGSSSELEKTVDQTIITSSSNENNETRSLPDEIENVTENISNYNNDIQQEEPLIGEELSNTENNLTQAKNEEIPSFSEWAQKRLEEVEKKEQVNSSSKTPIPNGKGSGAKLRWKNYASLDCGAKVIAANPESISPGAILSPSSDEYKLNPCTSRIWFIVELCETIQTNKIDLANYELFSSSPKDFTVSVSDRYPTRDWSIVGKFTAKDERDIQSFDIDTNIFGKYVKVEFKSHYGTEHYCPISLFRAYGTSVFEVLQKEDPSHLNRVDGDDDDDDDNEDGIHDNVDMSDNVDDSITIIEKESDDSRKNLFSSATDAVISIVKRAAEVLGNKVNNNTIKDTIDGNNGYFPLINTCITPNHIIYCKNCDDKHFDQIYQLISCKLFHIKKLLEIPFIYQALSNSVVCQSYDYEYKITPNSSYNVFTHYVTSFFPLQYIGAMCNEISILENRGILNNSEHSLNETRNMTYDKIFALKVQGPQASDLEFIKLENASRQKFPGSTLVNYSFETENLEGTHISQIKPSKPFIEDSDVTQTDIHLSVSSSEMNQTLEDTSTKVVETVSSKNVFEEHTELTPDMESIPEGIDVIDDHLEHFISELNVDHLPNPSAAPSTTTNSPQAQKESIFLRLSNRIKTLERNMSLSSQYLEELSRRYKKQVEEIQNMLEKTVISLREESIKKDLRNKQLEDRLDNLTSIIESLANEKQNWFLTVFWLIFSAVLMPVIYFFCRKYTFSKPTPDIENRSEVLYGKPINPLIQDLSENKKRRPSDQALNVLHYSAVNRMEHNFNQRQKKRKKKHALKKSNSIGNIKDGKCYANLDWEIKNNALDWVQKNHQSTEDTPYVLDESDHSALETTFPLENETLKYDPVDNTTSFVDIKIGKSSSHCFANNKAITDNSSLDTSSNKKLSTSSIDCVKKEKKSFKKLLKKVF